MPVVSTPLDVNTASCMGRKSSPTTPTTRTSVKKLAAKAKCVAAPPNTRSRLPLGVSRESNATEPTTRIANVSPLLRVMSLPLLFLLSFPQGICCLCCAQEVGGATAKQIPYGNDNKKSNRLYQYFPNNTSS